MTDRQTDGQNDGRTDNGAKNNMRDVTKVEGPFFKYIFLTTKRKFNLTSTVLVQ